MLMLCNLFLILKYHVSGSSLYHQELLLFLMFSDDIDQINC